MVCFENFNFLEGKSFLGLIVKNYLNETSSFVTFSFLGGNQKSSFLKGDKLNLLQTYRRQSKFLTLQNPILLVLYKSLMVLRPFENVRGCISEVLAPEAYTI